MITNILLNGERKLAYFLAQLLAWWDDNYAKDVRQISLFEPKKTVQEQKTYLPFIQEFNKESSIEHVEKFT